MASSAYAEDEESDHEKVEAEPVRTWGTATKVKIYTFLFILLS